MLLGRRGGGDGTNEADKSRKTRKAVAARWWVQHQRENPPRAKVERTAPLSLSDL